MRHLAFAFCLAGLTAGTAAAKPARPVDGALLPATSMPALQVVSGSPIAAAHVEAHADAVVACATYSRATFLRLRVSLRWDARARLQRVNVTSGSSAAFNRCAIRALGGSIADVTARGSAQAVLTLRKPAIVIAPKPVPPPVPAPPPVRSPIPEPKPLPSPVPTKVSLQTCKVDDDCTLRYTVQACVSTDPVAVNKGANRAALEKAFPVRRIECGMGGPQYDELRMSVADRWSSSCVKSRCVVNDAGPRPSMQDPLRSRP